jgi:hypothetical protein
MRVSTVYRLEPNGLIQPYVGYRNSPLSGYRHAVCCMAAINWLEPMRVPNRGQSAVVLGTHLRILTKRFAPHQAILYIYYC